MTVLAERLRHRLTTGHARDLAIQPADLRLEAPLDLAPAAVLIAVTDRPSPGVILTQRSAHLRKHAGQVAFPGGRMEEADPTIVAAALREAQEEVALPPERVTVIGTSDRYQTFTGFDISPVLGVIPADLPLRAQPGEVDSLFEVPLDYLLDPANRTRHDVEWQNRPMHYYEILWQDYRIWGVTAAIIANLSKRLGYDDPA